MSDIEKSPEIEPVKGFNLRIESEEDFKRLFSIIRGQDPDAQQIMNRFIDTENKVERSNFPTHDVVHLITFLDYVGLSFFPDTKNDPFSDLRDSLSTAFMAKGGWKSNSFVEIVKQSPSLAELQGINEAIQPKGLRDRFFGGSTNE